MGSDPVAVVVEEDENVGGDDAAGNTGNAGLERVRLVPKNNDFGFAKTAEEPWTNRKTQNLVLGVLVLALAAWAWVVWKPIVAQELTIGYREDLAKELVAYAAVVSCPEPSVLETWSCKMCVDGVTPIAAPPRLESVAVIKDNADVNQALVGYEAQSARVIVSFRGSVAIAQWIYDLDVTPMHVYCKDCLVHQGFYLSWKDLRQDVMAHVEEIARTRPVRQVHVTGHSLGAAMAVHAGLALRQAGYTVQGYTFGQPRVGNAAFAKYASTVLPQWFRVVNYLDPIPQAPKLPLFYHHMATEVYYYSRPSPGQDPGPYRVCSHDNGEDPTCQNAECGGLHLCIDGQFHVTYMNLPGITNVSALC
ncbi:Phospholipase A1-II 1 [Hondaea fermentalgiana]|uniref:Phospholipase A1-II 1 n=1 Tax=Hondaea fermentalgiana TaxID=2315210 RepID=A0A2R5G2R6_9STRA|nr:Phospholipase A1-II 1 [Hondaea fermentalgiana]|eukprot:GBG25292.1 Phospholipase A1-II 1 [Hondaea fermentalgiana]